MPELPEVQTTVDGINLLCQGATITSVWTDMFSASPIFKDSIKNKDYFTKVFKPTVEGRTIVSASRRAKYIILHLDQDVTVLIHMKMTGHIMHGSYVYNRKTNTWKPQEGQVSLEDPYNRFIHLVFTLHTGKQLVLCDMRKFAKVTLMTANVKKELSLLGPEPFDATYTVDTFVGDIFAKKDTYIKTALLDQRIVSGIGNIYSDEILHAAAIRPDRRVSSLSHTELQTIYKHIAPILRSGIDMGGDSMSDYRNIFGERGAFQGSHTTYRRTGLSCTRKTCTGIIERKVINTRSAHFCPVCQK